MRVSRYYVVVFIVPPNSDYDKYACVPESWLRWYDKQSSEAIVVYPEGNLAIINELVRKNHSDVKSWKTYMAFVEYSSHSFDDATNYIRLQKRPADPVSVLGNPSNRTRSPEDLPNSMLNSSLLTLDNDRLFISDRAHKRALPVDLDREVPIKLIRIEEMMEPVAEAAKQSASNERFSVHDDLMYECSQASTTLEALFEELAENTDLRPLIDDHDVRGLSQASNHHNTVTTEYDSFLMNLYSLFSVMTERFQRFALGVEHCRNINIENVDKFCEFTALMAYYSEWTRLTASGLNKAPKIDGLAAEIRNKGLPIGVDSDDTSKVLKPKIARFTLPPDYDPNDSKWTLRYRNPGPGLTELLPSSGIYVNTAILNECHRLAKNCKSLARLLIVEVFSDSALKVCSLTGANPACLNWIETDVRPGLDKDARAILVRYIEIYGREKMCCSEKPKAIINSMRNKLYCYRLKNRNNV